MARPSATAIALTAAVVFAGAASFLMYGYLTKQGGKTTQGIPVACAAADLPVGTKVQASQVKYIQWPKESLPTGCLKDAAALSGRVVVRPLSAGDIITEQKLLPRNVTGGIMTYIVPEGHRAVTVAVNEVAGVAGFITPSSRVDVVLTTPKPGSERQEDTVSKIILQNVPVLASGQVTEQKDGKPGIVPTVTLDLVPDDAEKLIVGVGAKKGSLQLLLRNVVDVASIETRGATVAKALGGVEPTAAPVRRASQAKPRAKVEHPAAVAITTPKYPVEVFKGGAKFVREFPAE